MVRTTYLELTSLDRLVPARDPGPEVAFVRARIPSPELNRFFYLAVGADFFWRDRVGWTYARWLAHLDRPGYETWYLTCQGTPAGYVELDAGRPPDVEIANLGLLPSFVGRGLGGWLLDRAGRRCFELGSRVWLHTCTLDGPGALPSYRRRGFEPFDVTESTVELPPTPHEVWPGAGPRSAA
jgi:GNAT superfamily N-acetyltransferase